MKISINCGCDIIVEDIEFVEGFYNVIALQYKERVIDSYIKTSIEDEVIFRDKDDGYYKLYALSLKNSPEEAEKYYIQDEIYYDLEGNEVSLQTILEDSEVYKDIIPFFSSMKLYHAYITECKKIILQSERCNTGLDTYRRDLLRSVFDTIGYLVDCENFDEAQEIINKISGCNGLYENEYQKCGCIM